MRSQRLTSGVALLAGVLALGGCFMGDPKGPVLGFRLDHGVVTVAYPLCADSKVLGVDVTEYTDSGPYPKVWHGEDPTSEAVERGVFVINSSTSFRTTSPDPSKPLPDGVFVGATEPGHPTGGRDDYLDLPKLRAFHPEGPDSYYTSEGPMTRAEINDQLKCNRK
ncbi:hypothetical protein [Streptomyces sp. NPDC049040]|uniref:hypothetical protein n=1 Tax=Streptomyces sp. NPDC049040 TaxID=3365593 RepID=UPI00371B978C